ncbi:MAG: DNA alkylation repair protein [Luteibaculaceae bacterium]
MLESRRKGSKSIKEIPPEILRQLNSGAIETANLVEWLAINQTILLENILTEANRIQYLEPIILAINTLKKQSVNTINEAIGVGILTQTTLHNDTQLLSMISSHKSDMVRCWAAYAVGKNSTLSLSQKLEQIKPFAADAHFAVREIAWLAFRHTLAKNLAESITILSNWTQSENENIRRFASEATRPRGVWCEHITELKNNPALGLVILEPLKADESKYVQDSVGNWLNDASKSDPNFVVTTCAKWIEENPTKETYYITKKALRTIQKNKI